MKLGKYVGAHDSADFRNKGKGTHADRPAGSWSVKMGVYLEDFSEEASERSLSTS